MFIMGATLARVACVVLGMRLEASARSRGAHALFRAHALSSEGHAQEMATQVQRTAAARKRLIAAATELIAAHGSGQSSLMEIGQRAGMSRGAVNFHFGSKMALVETVLTEAALACKQETLMPADLASLFTDNHSAWFEDPARARFIPMLFAEGLTAQTTALRAPIVELCSRWRDGTTNTLLHLQFIGAVRTGLDLESESALIVASLLGLVAQRLADPEFNQEDAYTTFCATATGHLEVISLVSHAPTIG